MDFARLAATREPDRLNFGPPFAPKAQRCALTYVASMAVLTVTAPTAAKASSSPVQKRLCDQRLKRL